MLTPEDRAELISVFEERRRLRTDDNGILAAVDRIVARHVAAAEARADGAEQKLAAVRALADQLADNPHVSWPGAFKRLHATLGGEA